MGILLGLSAALFWGGADFFVGYATRMVGTYRTLFYMQFFGLIGLAIYLAITGAFAQLVTGAYWQAWAWALLVALLNVISSLSLYRAYEVGVISVVSPIVASCAALTVVLALLSGERLTMLHGVGIAIALFGVVLVATSFSSTGKKDALETSEGQNARLARKKGLGLPPGIAWGLTATVGYGFVFWILGFYVTPTLGGIAPVWLMRVVTLCVLSLVAAPLKQNMRVPRGRVWWFIAAVGILDTIAYVSYAIGVTTAQVAVVSVIASLFSAITVLLAWIFIREKLQWSQWLGIGIIFVAVALVNL